MTAQQWCGMSSLSKLAVFAAALFVVAGMLALGFAALVSPSPGELEAAAKLTETPSGGVSPVALLIGIPVAAVFVWWVGLGEGQ